MNLIICTRVKYCAPEQVDSARSRPGPISEQISRAESQIYHCIQGRDAGSCYCDKWTKIAFDTGYMLQIFLYRLHATDILIIATHYRYFDTGYMLQIFLYRLNATYIFIQSTC